MNAFIKLKAKTERTKREIYEELAIRRNLIEFIIFKFITHNKKRNWELIEEMIGLRYEVFKHDFFWNISFIKEIEKRYRKYVDPNLIIRRFR